MNFLKTTVVGGLLFLIPITALVFILGKTFALMSRVAHPLARWIPVERIAGIALANILAVVCIVLACFVAGLIARSRVAARWVESLESGVLYSIPGYAILKGMTGGLAGDQKEQEMIPVLAKFDDAAQLAFQVELLPDGRSVLYIPGAPDPWSGGIFVMEADRVEALDVKMVAAIRNLRGLGRGSTKLLAAVIRT